MGNPKSLVLSVRKLNNIKKGGDFDQQDSFILALIILISFVSISIAGEFIRNRLKNPGLH